MNLPPALTDACRAGRLLPLWGALPWPLSARPPVDPALALNRRCASDGALPPPAFALHGLPPLPVLSLDPSERVERAFEGAGVPLQVVLTRHDVPVHGRHSLFKLAGDLGTRRGVILSRAALRDLHADGDKRYLLDEARRVAAGGAVLWLGVDPADEDLSAWWSVLRPVFRAAAVFALGAPEAVWPQGVTCLGTGGAALSAALRSATAASEPDLRASLAPLRELLTERLNLQETRACCFDLGVDFESLGGEGKAGKLQALLAHLVQREALPRLIDWLHQNRPDMDAALDEILEE